MKTGDVLAGRWRLDEAVPATGGIQRWRATDEQTGDVVDVLGLVAGRSRAEDRRAFGEVHRGLASPSDDGVVPTLAVAHEEPRAHAVRPALAEATLGDVKGPLPAEVVAAIGARLLPAVLAAGSATRGTLLATDVGLDLDGRPVVAPRGTPLNEVVRGTTRAVAPEVYAGRSPDGSAGLYGLGVLLFRLATGREPEVMRGGAPPAPASSVRYGIPPQLDEAVLRLLDTDPARRTSALPLLQEAAAGESVPDLRPHAKRVAVVGDVNLSVSGGTGVRVTASAGQPPRGRQDEVPRALVIVPHRALSRLEPSDRHLAAGLAGVSLQVVDEAIAKGLPLVVQGFPLRAEATRQARQWTLETGLRLHAGVAGTGRALWLPFVVTLAIGAPLALLTVVLALVGVWVLAVPAAAALAVDGTFAVLTWLWLRNLAADWAAANDAWRLVDRHRARYEALGLEPVSRDLAALRVQLARADLPPAAASDLRSVLKEVDEKISALEARAMASAGALTQVDGAGLRARLGALNGQPSLDAAQTAERDRLAQTLADLDDVEARQQSVRDEAHRLRDALAEVAAILGRLGDDDSDAVLADLGRGAMSVADVARQPAPADRDERARRARQQAQARERTVR